MIIIIFFFFAITPSEHNAHYMKQVKKLKKKTQPLTLSDRPLVLSLSLSPSLSPPPLSHTHKQ